MNKKEKQKLLKHYKSIYRDYKEYNIISVDEFMSVKSTLNLVFDNDQLVKKQIEVNLFDNEYLIKRWLEFCEWTGSDRIYRLDQVDILKSDLMVYSDNNEQYQARKRSIKKFFNLLEKKKELYNS